MAFDVIAEVVIRVVAQFVVETLFVGVFYWPGWVILRVLTLGRYPPPQSHPHNREFVAIMAFAILLAGMALHYSSSFA
jgi:hypothetical protein